MQAQALRRILIWTPNEVRFVFANSLACSLWILNQNSWIRIPDRSARTLTVRQPLIKFNDWTPTHRRPRVTTRRVTCLSLLSVRGLIMQIEQFLIKSNKATAEQLFFWQPFGHHVDLHCRCLLIYVNLPTTFPTGKGMNFWISSNLKIKAQPLVLNFKLIVCRTVASWTVEQNMIKFS